MSDYQMHGPRVQKSAEDTVVSTQKDNQYSQSGAYGIIGDTPGRSERSYRLFSESAS